MIQHFKPVAHHLEGVRQHSWRRPSPRPFALLGPCSAAVRICNSSTFGRVRAAWTPAAPIRSSGGEGVGSERPQLKIEVPIAWVANSISHGAGRGAVLSQVREAQSGTRPQKAESCCARRWITWNPSGQLELLTRLYEKNFGGEPKYPETVTSIKAKPDAMPPRVIF